MTCVNSVHSANNFCRVCNVNLLYNIWIWKVQLIRRCPFQRARKAAKLSSEVGFPVNKESTASFVLCMKCRREFDKFEKNFEGLRFLKRRLIRRSRSREKCQNGELTWTECKGATNVRRLRTQAAQKHRRERQIIDRSFDGNFGEFGPF